MARYASFPSRGTWIEMLDAAKKIITIHVVPLAGNVD